MDLAQEELQFLSISQILKEAISVPRRSPHTFTLLTLTLVFPLSLAVLLHSLLTHSLLPSSSHHNNNNPNIPLLVFYQLLYLLFLFSFSLLSTASAVFTVASLYSSRPASFPDSLRAVPPAFRRLFPTFLVISLLILLYHLAFILSLLALLALARAHYDALFLLLLPVFLFAFLAAHVYVTALWHLASVVTVLEPVRGFAAVRKSRELLRGKVREAAALVLMYLAACATVGVAFGEVVVRGGARYGLATKVLVGGVLVALLVVVNVVGLLVQSVFYYVCKSYHHEDIDKTALHDHLGGYLGEYVPLKSSIQMESLDI